LLTGFFELHHDEPANTALPVREFLAKKCIPLLPQAPYFPYLSPCHCYLFSKLKSRAKGYHFQTVGSVEKAVTDAIKTVQDPNRSRLPILVCGAENSLRQMYFNRGMLF
jgi:hypothetical protein